MGDQPNLGAFHADFLAEIVKCLFFVFKVGFVMVFVLLNAWFSCSLTLSADQFWG